jgi:centrin-1
MLRLPFLFLLFWQAPIKNPRKRTRGQHEIRQLSKEQEQAVSIAFHNADIENEGSFAFPLDIFHHLQSLTVKSRSRTTGSIEVNDAKLALQSLGVTIQKEDIHSFLSPAEDSLDLHLFSQIATIKLEQKQTSETAFALFDQNGKGVICLEDLQQICKELEEDFTNDDLQEMVDEADCSGEGFISKLDFYRIIRKLNL